MTWGAGLSSWRSGLARAGFVACELGEALIGITSLVAAMTIRRACPPLLSSTASPGGNDLAGVEVKRTSGPGVLIRVDPERQILVISGASAGRAVLADNLLSMVSAQDGGHLHVGYFPGHFYLAEGSLSLVVNSPHGGMPTR